MQISVRSTELGLAFLAVWRSTKQGDIVEGINSCFGGTLLEIGNLGVLC